MCILTSLKNYDIYAEGLGFNNVASAPMVRSSYHADLQASGKSISALDYVYDFFIVVAVIKAMYSSTVDEYYFNIDRSMLNQKI